MLEKNISKKVEAIINLCSTYAKQFFETLMKVEEYESCLFKHCCVGDLKLTTKITTTGKNC